MHLPRPLHPPLFAGALTSNPLTPLTQRMVGPGNRSGCPQGNKGLITKGGMPLSNLLQELPERVHFVASRATRAVPHLCWIGVPDFSQEPVCSSCLLPLQPRKWPWNHGLVPASTTAGRQGKVSNQECWCGGSWLSRRGCGILGPPRPSLVDGGGMGWSLPTFQSHPSQQQVMQKGAKPLAMITEENSCPHDSYPAHA